MSLEDLVSDWELEEILSELRCGGEREFVAFRHGLSENDIPEDFRLYESRYRRRVERRRERAEREAERAKGKAQRKHADPPWVKVRGIPFDKYERQFVRDNWPNHGKRWKGWEILGRPYSEVSKVAAGMKLRKRRNNVVQNEEA